MFDLLKFINHNKKINGKGVFEVYGTYYHLTPYDMGNSAELEPRKPSISNWKAISGASNILYCLIAMPKEKTSTDKFFVYRNKRPEKAYRQIFEDGLTYDEVRMFKKTEFIKVGVLQNCIKVFDIFRDIDHIGNEDNLEKQREALKELIFIKQRKTFFVPFAKIEKRNIII
ncbi:hypothetical protein WAE56_07115 [Iodobacter sp. LRB]|uniref:hypothetical protein n=1 Tax=unclassified Iodobacter TaxID=235634 RepID=UPI000C10A573|nr:hypothetical protein [Iodobacter sp. BJB302]PHV02371.1 hypothetical protein CSQ88_07525 [Iodobacter sp. BJB302]